MAAREASLQAEARTGQPDFYRAGRRTKSPNQTKYFVTFSDLLLENNSQVVNFDHLMWKIPQNRKLFFLSEA